VVGTSVITPIFRDKRSRAGAFEAMALLVIRCVSLLAHQLVLGLIYQPLLFFLLPFCCCSSLLFFLPRLGDRAYLLHQAQGIGIGPVLHELAALEAADGDA
jgi:hypothetical protein